MADLVTPTQLAALIKQDMSDPVEQAAAVLACKTASGVVRRYCRQTITAVTDDVVELKGNWGTELELPERPVTNVHAISLNGVGLTLANYRWDRRGRLYWGTAALFNDDPPLLAYWGGDKSVVTVTYDHGFAAVPDEVVGVAAQVAARVHQNPLGKIEQRTEGYTQTLPGVFPLELSRAEKEILNVYRRRTW